MKKIFWLATAMTLMGLSARPATVSVQTDQPEKNQIVLRIKNVENGLLEFNAGAPLAQKKWTLAERMALRKVPGGR
jgi:hypothetical protein